MAELQTIDAGWNATGESVVDSASFRSRGRHKPKALSDVGPEALVMDLHELGKPSQSLVSN